MRNKWRILLFVLITVLLAAAGFHLILSQKEADKKPKIITAPPMREKVPQEKEAIKHGREEGGDVPPLWENRRWSDW